VRVTGSERVRTSLSVGGALPVSQVFRLQASLAAQLPVGMNEVMSLSFSVVLIRSWS
jgi:hypothetical protein